MADHSRFVIDKGSDGLYYFFLRARNGQVLVTSETYTTQYAAKGGVQAVRGVAPTAPVVDITNR